MKTWSAHDGCSPHFHTGHYWYSLSSFDSTSWSQILLSPNSIPYLKHHAYVYTSAFHCITQSAYPFQTTTTNSPIPALWCSFACFFTLAPTSTHGCRSIPLYFNLSLLRGTWLQPVLKSWALEWALSILKTAHNNRTTKVSGNPVPRGNHGFPASQWLLQPSKFCTNQVHLWSFPQRLFWFEAWHVI